MKTLIVLCAGGRMIDDYPVFLKRHPNGKLLAEEAINGIYVDTYDRIVYTVLRETVEKYDVLTTFRNEISEKYNVQLAILDKPTKGPAESVYKTIKKMAIEGEFVVRDSLNRIKIQENVTGNFVAGLDLTKYDEDIFNIKSKSFIVTNEQNQILDIIEKRFRSDVISVGLYGFKNASDFVTAYEKLSDVNYPIKRLYLSNVIAYLIGYKQRVFHCVEAYFHEDWGTFETWNRLQNKYATIFVDADKLIGRCYSDKDIDCLVEKLDRLSEKEISTILFTRTPIINKKALYDKLEEKKIRCIDMISNVSYSYKQALITNDADLRNVLLEV